MVLSGIISITMMIKSRNSEATFRIFSQDDQKVAIEMVIPESSPTIVSGFATEQAAENWIVAYKERLETAETGGRRSFYTRSKRA